jgi:hypothetical protein
VEIGGLTEDGMAKRIMASRTMETMGARSNIGISQDKLDVEMGYNLEERGLSANSTKGIMLIYF